MHNKLYINGEWVERVNGQTLDVVNPFTEQVYHQVAAGDVQDIERAVAAAKQAFVSWKKTTVAQRAEFLTKMADLTEKRLKKLSELETIDSGKPYPEAEWDIEDVVGFLNITLKPMGVVGAIIPFNYPALMALWKIAPALAAGCTVILKPSELTPVTALELAEIAHDVGLPAGVLNVVTGTGPAAGAPLVAHPDVRKIGFTGSVPTGQLIATSAVQDVKNVSLELGGKSPALVFDSANIERAVEWVMFGCFWTNGQICSATSRLLIQDSIADEFLRRLIEETNRIVMGDPMAKDTKLGPVVSKAQQVKIRNYIDNAQKQGATIACGGSAQPDGLSGFFIKPTVLTDVTPEMTIWKEEVFGPVLSVMRFQTEEEAVALANGSEYGLGSAVFSTCSEQLQRVTKELEAGIVWNNCSQPCFVQLPWGGFKKSSTGRELGPFGLNAYLEPKQVCTYVADEQFGWYFGGATP